MRHRRGRRTSALVLAVSVAAACSDPSGALEEQRYRGVLQLAEYIGTTPATESSERDPEQTWSEEPGEDVVVPPVVIALPAGGVEAGKPFEITTYTVGNGCTVADGQDVQISGNVVELTPYDRQVGEVCTMQLVFVPHSSTVTLDTPGEWVIRVSGRKVRYQESTWEQPVFVEKTITVH